MFDGVAVLAEGLHDEIDVYHAREFTAVLLRRHLRRGCPGKEAANKAVGWMQVFLYRWGSTAGSTVAVFGGWVRGEVS